MSLNLVGSQEKIRNAIESKKLLKKEVKDMLSQRRIEQSEWENERQNFKKEIETLRFAKDPEVSRVSLHLGDLML